MSGTDRKHPGTKVAKHYDLQVGTTNFGSGVYLDDEVSSLPSCTSEEKNSISADLAFDFGPLTPMHELSVD
eukprot:3363589-Rhodomonas_salina.2